LQPKQSDVIAVPTVGRDEVSESRESNPVVVNIITTETKVPVVMDKKVELDKEKGFPKKTKFIKIKTIEQEQQLKTQPPSFKDWGIGAVAASPWQVPKESALPPPPSTALEFTTPTKKASPMAKNVDDIPQNSLTLGSFMTPPVHAALQTNSAAKPSTSGRGWSSSSGAKSRLSLSQIQSEEETLRVNGNIAHLQGHDNPWFIERRIRTGSFEQILESQRIENEEELRRKTEAARRRQNSRKKK
jgi:hypothetical protein